MPLQINLFSFMRRNEKDVQDVDMAHFYSKSGGSTINTIGKKFATKRDYEGKLKYVQCVIKQDSHD